MALTMEYASVLEKSMVPSIQIYLVPWMGKQTVPVMAKSKDRN
jgi:hypothetical protein